MTKLHTERMYCQRTYYFNGRIVSSCRRDLSLHHLQCHRILLRGNAIEKLVYNNSDLGGFPISLPNLYNAHFGRFNFGFLRGSPITMFINCVDFSYSVDLTLTILL